MNTRGPEFEPTTPNITLASVEDLDDVMVFFEAAYAGAYEPAIPREAFEDNEAFRESLRDELDTQLTDDRTRLYLAKQSGKIVVTIGVTLSKGSAVADLWGFYVSPPPARKRARP
jgi:hypothetical protein